MSKTLYCVAFSRQESPAPILLHYSSKNVPDSLKKRFQDAIKVTANQGKPGSATSQHLDEKYMCHTRILNSGLVASAICDLSYPSNAAFAFLTKALETFTTSYSESKWQKETGKLPAPGIPELLTEYHQAEQVDKVAAIQSDLNETKQILETNISNLLERGEKLENLEQTTIQLEAEANKMKENAVDLNRCCCCHCPCLAQHCSCFRCFERCTIL